MNRRFFLSTIGAVLGCMAPIRSGGVLLLERMQAQYRADTLEGDQRLVLPANNRFRFLTDGD